MGFSKHKTSGKVDTNKVYYGGRHWVGVMYTFKKYPADIQILNFNQIEIFNQENIKITLTAVVHYKLNPKYLKYLHDTYDLQYEKVLEATAVSALKSAAPSFKVDEYRLERAKVAEGLKKSINRALGGNCCPLKNCTGSTLCEPGEWLQKLDKFCTILVKNHREVFNTQSKIFDKFFWENSKLFFELFDYFRKKLHPKCFLSSKYTSLSSQNGKISLIYGTQDLVH